MSKITHTSSQFQCRLYFNEIYFTNVSDLWNFTQFDFTIYRYILEFCSLINLRENGITFKFWKVFSKMDDTRLLSNHGENDEFNKSYSFLMLEMFIETYKHIWKRSRSEMAQLKSMYYRHFSYNTDFYLTRWHNSKVL